MPRITTILLITALLSGGSTLHAVPASAQQPPQSSSEEATKGENKEGEKAVSDTQRFRELGRVGAKAFSKKDYAAAVEAFRAAYEIKAVPNLLYNIGRALEKQGDFEGAIAQYEQFVNEPEVELKARQDALQRLKTLREVLALREEGKEVDPETVDEQQGERELADAVEADGDADSDDHAGDPAGDLAGNKLQAPPAKLERDYTLAYVFGATGVAALLGSGVFAGLAAIEKSAFEGAATLAGRRSAADTGHTYTAVADSMLVAGAVFGAAGVYFWTAAPQESPAEGARVVPSVGPGGASVTFSLDF